MDQEELQEVAADENVGTTIPGEEAPSEASDDFSDGGEFDEGQGDEPPAVSFEDEAKARDMGWRPKDEWNGSEAAWRPASEFLKRGEEILPIVKSRAEKAERKVADLEKNLQSTAAKMQKDFDDRMRRMEGVNQKAMERQRQQIYEDYENRKAEAVNNSDPDAYNDLNARQREALRAHNEQMASYAPAAPEPEPETPAEPEVPPEVKQTVEAWIGRNAWYKTDEDMQALAETAHKRLNRDKPGMSLEQNLSEVEKIIRQRFPEKFAPANHAPAVEGGGRQPGSSGARSKGWNDLPREAKEAGARFVEEGSYGKDQKKGREQYAKDYWDQG